MSCFKQSCCVFRWVLQFENQGIVTLIIFFSSLIVKCESFSYFPCSATTNQTFHRLCDINLHGVDTSMQVL